MKTTINYKQMDEQGFVKIDDLINFPADFQPFNAIECGKKEIISVSCLLTKYTCVFYMN